MRHVVVPERASDVTPDLVTPLIVSYFLLEGGLGLEAVDAQKLWPYHGPKRVVAESTTRGQGLRGRERFGKD